MTAPVIKRPAGFDGDPGKYALLLVYDATNDQWVPANADTTSGGQVVVGNVGSGVADVGNPVKIGAKYNLAVPTFTDGQRADLQANANGALRVELAMSASGLALNTQTTATDGVATVGGNNRTLTVAAVTYTFNGTTFDRDSKGNTTSRIASAAASTNATSAKASAGTLTAVDAMNTTASVKYLKLYNKASAPTVGTDTPVLTIPLAPSNARSAMTFPKGMYFSAGIAYALTGAAADADATALAAGDVVGVNLVYS